MKLSRTPLSGIRNLVLAILLTGTASCQKPFVKTTGAENLVTTTSKKIQTPLSTEREVMEKKAKKALSGIEDNLKKISEKILEKHILKRLDSVGRSVNTICESVHNKGEPGFAYVFSPQGKVISCRYMKDSGEENAQIQINYLLKTVTISNSNKVVSFQFVDLADPRVENQISSIIENLNSTLRNVSLN